MCTERAPPVPASACIGLGYMNTIDAAHDGRKARAAPGVQESTAQVAQRSMQGLAWQLATALAARTISQQLVEALRQALPPARDIRLCLRTGAQHLATSGRLMVAGEFEMQLTPVNNKCMASRCIVLGAPQLAESDKQHAHCSGGCRCSMYVPVAHPQSAGTAALGCLVIGFVCTGRSSVQRCLPAVSDLVSALSQPLATATAGLRAQLEAAAAVLARPRPPMPRLCSIPEGGLPVEDPDDDAVSESPSLAERLALLAELTDAESDSEANVGTGTDGSRRHNSGAGSEDEARPSCREDPNESWRHDDDGSAPALPVTSPAQDEDTAQDAAALAPPPPLPSLPLLPPPLPSSAADPQDQTQAWPPHGSPQWRSSIQAQPRAAAGSPGSSVLDDRSAAATAGEPSAPSPAGANALPRAAGSGVTDSPASEGAVSTGPVTPRKLPAAAESPQAAAPPAAAAALHPLWLSFADPALERAFVAWCARQTQLWDIVQMTVVLVNILAKSAPYWRLLPPLWYLSVAVKAAAFACMLAYPRRWARRREALLAGVMAVSFACLVAMTTPHHLRLIADRYGRTIVLRALALPNLAAYTLTVWVRFRALLPVAIACWAAAATLAPQFCADNTVAWLGLTGGQCTAAAMTLQGVGCVGVPLLIRRWCERRARRRFLLQLRTRT